MSARKGWNIISRSYQLKTRISLEDVHYGPISAGELELRLLGSVRDKDLLEVGCGGGQNAIVLAKWGARSVGLDISAEQIRYARKLARKEGVKVPFHVGNMEDLGVFKPESFDIVLSSFAMQFADDILAAFQEVFRVLRNAGLFVFAVCHPLIGTGRPMRRGKRKVWAVSDYFDRRKRVWKWKVQNGTAEFCGRQITIQDYSELLAGAGFAVDRILEPQPYAIEKMSEAELEMIPYLEAGFLRDYDLWRKVPYTIIFRASKNPARPTTPIRWLEGITYWVIENPETIRDFVNTEVRKEWEADARSEHRDPKDDPWLKGLTRRRWHLEIMDMARIKLDPDIMNYVDPERGYVFSKSLEKRSAELRHNIECGAVVLSPLIVRDEDTQLVDGYCRYSGLKAMSVSRTYAYVGSL